jgi:D-alanyl-D-alanine carboxypeptidase
MRPVVEARFPRECGMPWRRRRGHRLWSCMLMLLLMACTTAPAIAQLTSVDDYLMAEMAKRRIPGLALAVVQRGEVVKLQGYGIANLEWDIPVTPDTVFELASVTKQFTATAIMRLVEEGKIRLEEPISRYLADTPATWSGITVRHLLTHTAGLASLENGFHTLWANGARLNYTTAEMYAAAKEDPLSFAPGARWQYSDVGYFLLGMILEKVTGQRYRDIMTERFFRPLGMASTSLLDQSAIVKNRAAGYTLREGRWVQIRRVIQTELPSHYGIFSTVADLVRWEKALAGGTVLTTASLTQMWTPATLSDGSTVPYGFAWGVMEERGHRVISHTGITGTEYTRYPDDQLTVIVLTNLGKGVRDTTVNAWGLTRGVAGRFLPGFLLSSLTPQPEPDPTLRQRLREILADLAKGAETPRITAGVRAGMPAENRKILAARLAALTEFSFLACDDVRRQPVTRLGASVTKRCYFKMVTGPETRYYTFWLTPDDRVADFSSSTE